MKAQKRIWVATSLVPALILSATLTTTTSAAEHPTFHLVGHLKLPATKIPNDYHHLHVFDTNGQRLVTVSDSNNIMTIIDVSDRTNPTLARQVRLPAVVAHGDPVTLTGGVALVTERTGKPEIPEARTVSVVEMRGQTESKVTGRFENVTGLEVDASNSHVYIISGVDLWILGGGPYDAFFR